MARCSIPTCQEGVSAVAFSLQTHGLACRAARLNALFSAVAQVIRTGGLDDLLLNRSWDLCCDSAEHRSEHMLSSAVSGICKNALSGRRLFTGSFQHCTSRASGIDPEALEIQKQDDWCMNAGSPD